MRKIISLVVALVLVGLVVSCAGNSPSPTPTPTSTLTPTPIANGGDEPPIDATWISPGKVWVGNESDGKTFYPGARAEWPLLVHNGNDYVTAFDIAYRYPDHVDEGWYKTVESSYECPDCAPLEDYGCWADYTEEVWNCPDGEDLRAGPCALETEEEISKCVSSVYKLKYACNSGPRAVTEVDTTGRKITYECWSSFGEPSLEYLCPECQYWVIIADPTPVISPYGTREILVALDMPKDAESPGEMWEFWISVMDKSQGEMVQTELCSRWLVQMR